ncbi:type VII secretion protein EccE [Rhodococcus sp. ABRD24]|uniref:type VII secretion protein EccE n=1 Tax=Rhodococcus sp. ABRD24 TaxID=2507582 RepID=UPI00103E8251|nr:type VII secretion protein EccE [Rhodococcus sp. ABRD24]QBJ95517.1 type VII secretion protein EccE [Rhodococcus sp. ABRD24]
MDHCRVGRRPRSAAVLVATIITGEALAVLVACLALSAGSAVWAAVVAGILVGALPFARFGGRPVLSWAENGWRYLRDTRPDSGRTVDFRAPGQSVGLHWSGGQVLAVVELIPPSRSLTRITREGFDSPGQLPVTTLAQCLEQHDVTLSGIDVLSHGRRSAPGIPAADVYDTLIGPLPAIAQRSVWVVLRFDAADNAASVARRGGGEEGASRTVTVAATRIVRAIADAGCHSRILTASEIEAVAARLSHGVSPADMGQEWSHVPTPGAHNVGNAIDPRRLTRELLAAVWAAPGLDTTVAIHLRPGRASQSVRVGATFRRTTRTLPGRLGLRGLVSMQGRHRDGLLSQLPTAPPELDGIAPMTEVDPRTLDALCLPVSGCGQLIGSDSDGHAVSARITGPGVSNVHVAGELYLAQQIVFRAVATGARILIHTDRPHAWAPLVDAVATPDLLRIAGGPAWSDTGSWSDTGFDTILLDGIGAPPARAGVTTIHLSSDPGLRLSATTDVSIVQPGAGGDRVVLTAGEHRVELVLVTIPSETAFIGRPRSATRLAPAR